MLCQRHAISSGKSILVNEQVEVQGLPHRSRDYVAHIWMNGNVRQQAARTEEARSRHQIEHTSPMDRE
jgi:hypothetical protein